MSDADHRTVAIDREGATLEKELNTDDFAVPSIVFTIRGPADGRTTVRVRDPIPDGVGSGDVGFHPKHGGEFWTHEGEHVVFSREFEPGEEFTTVYGVVGADPAEDWISSEPSVDVVDGGATDASPQDGSTEDADGPAEPTDDDGTGTGTNVLVRLAVELERGSNEDVRRVREALLDADGDLTTRVDRLRAEVDDLADSTESLASSAESVGSAGDRLDDLSSELETIERRVDDLEDGPLPAGEGTGGDGDIDEVRSAVDAVRTTVEELETTVDEAKAGMERNARDIDDLGAELMELDMTVDSLVADPAAAAAGDGEPADLADALEEMQSDLDSARAFQERFKSTLLEYDSR